MKYLFIYLSARNGVKYDSYPTTQKEKGIVYECVYCIGSISL